MKKQKELDIQIKLCTDCFNCKKKKNRIYCKYGVWEEVENGKTILHSPFDYSCPYYED